MKRIQKLYLWWQLAVSILPILIGVVFAIRCATEHSGDVYVFLFVCLAYAGYRFMFIPSINELRKVRAEHRKGGES